MSEIRHDWTIAEARALYELPIPELVFRAQSIHRVNHPPDAVQLCTLLSIKTGACPEDCKYCSQSSQNEAALNPEKLLDVEQVLSKAREAKAAGATRFCMGAAWRGPKKEGPHFGRVLQMVAGVREIGLEACATLGMLDEEQARQLKDAGLTAYNHNLDTSKEFYGEIVSTRSYEDRLDTIQTVSDAGISVCSGGIIGMGESDGDRMAMLVTLANLDPQPESVPVNSLVAVSGTPLEEQEPVDAMEMVRMCATARILMPRAMVRLSAGRSLMSREAQMLCFVAGANSIFYGDRLLTTENAQENADLEMLHAAGMRALTPKDAEAGVVAGAEALPSKLEEAPAAE